MVFFTIFLDNYICDIKAHAQLRGLFYRFFALRDFYKPFYEEEMDKNASFGPSLTFLERRSLWVNWRAVFNLDS